MIIHTSISNDNNEPKVKAVRVGDNYSIVIGDIDNNADYCTLVISKAELKEIVNIGLELLGAES